MSKLQVAIGVGAAVIGAFMTGQRCSAPSASHSTQACSKKGSEQDLAEFSVVYTNRATNLMAPRFTKVMQDISRALKTVYNADAMAMIPGSGSYAMEAAARQFGMGKKCMVLRNGYFSFRWSDIFAQCKIPSEEIVLMGRAIDSTATPMFAPHPIDEVVAEIKSKRPAVVFAPHVETSTGIILPDSYIRTVADAVHEVGGLFILDCIASGSIWVDMKKSGVDALITAPQKGWSGPACVGILMMNQRAKDQAMAAGLNDAGSFACNLKKWIEVMDKYEAGGFMYYSTLPTDALISFRDAVLETEAYGWEKSKADMWTMGNAIRGVLKAKGYPGVAAPGFEAPGVVVSYAKDASMVAKFKAQGLQIAGGVPFKINEPEGLNTFRLGLFGLDKIGNIPATVSQFEKALVGTMA